MYISAAATKRTHAYAKNNIMDDGGRSSRADRKTVEKQRRDHMKSLYSNLTALIPRTSPRETSSISDQLDEATNYINRLRAKLEELKDKKDRLSRAEGDRETQGLCLPDIDIHATGSTVHVALITGLQYKSMFKQVIQILHEEGGDVVNANYSVVDQTVFHTVQAQMGDERLIARVSERLKNFVYDI